ncbi:MAG TPA: hypothetical protein VNL15_00635 [Dehalococcoidia bacterium]|nr:hypothetical protein [Dehalococcoidia bacterium]
MPLELNPHGFLHFMQLVRREGNHVEISEGRYVFSESANPDDESAWFLRYEYERSPAPGKPQGHLHVNAERKGINIKHIHLPVSRISIEQLIAHLILEHEIQSLDPKAMEILAESHRGFLKRRTDFETDAFP